MLKWISALSPLVIKDIAFPMCHTMEIITSVGQVVQEGLQQWRCIAIQVVGDVIRGSRNQDYNLYVLKCAWDSLKLSRLLNTSMI